MILCLTDAIHRLAGWLCEAGHDESRGRDDLRCPERDVGDHAGTIGPQRYGGGWRTKVPR